MICNQKLCHNVLVTLKNKIKVIQQATYINPLIIYKSKEINIPSHFCSKKCKNYAHKNYLCPVH